LLNAMGDKSMRHKKNGNIEWLEFELLADLPHLVHGVFLRQGGISEGPFSSLNIGGGTGDKPEHVEANRKRVQEALGVSRLVSGFQEHGAHIEKVSTDVQAELPPCDGMITQDRDIGLMIKHADCQAAIIYDPVHQAVGNVHAGWRGNVRNVYASAIAKMKKEFNSRPEDLLVCISPSLGPKWAEFKNYKDELPVHFWKFQVEPTYFDLWEIARTQLEECGILADHLEIASICTYSHPKDFYSYRRDKVTGRNTTIVALK
jgi:YfiH family protein